jgi:hypothetical protein
MHEYGHDKHGITHYLVFAMKLGLSGLLRLAGRYAGAVGELFRLRREQLSEGSKVLREEHERRMAILAQTTRIGRDRMRALAELQVPRITRTLHGILASVLLDRLALGLAAAFTLVVVSVLTMVHAVHAWWIAPCVMAVWLLGDRLLAGSRTVDPEKRMIERAADLARLFPAAVVVMGHTHAPARMTVNDGLATYINLGSWAEEEGDERDAVHQAHRAARTHLQIHDGEEGPVAELFAWDTDLGPKPFLARLGSTSPMAGATPVRPMLLPRA